MNKFKEGADIKQLPFWGRYDVFNSPLLINIDDSSIFFALRILKKRKLGLTNKLLANTLYL